MGHRDTQAAWWSHKATFVFSLIKLIVGSKADQSFQAQIFKELSHLFKHSFKRYFLTTILVLNKWLPDNSDVFFYIIARQILVFFFFSDMCTLAVHTQIIHITVKTRNVTCLFSEGLISIDITWRSLFAIRHEMDVLHITCALEIKS